MRSKHCITDSHTPTYKNTGGTTGPLVSPLSIITDAQYAELLANGRAGRNAARDGIELDPKPVVKLFTPHWFYRWLLTEIDPEYPQRAYGLCGPGDGRPHLGYVALRDLDDVHE